MSTKQRIRVFEQRAAQVIGVFMKIVASKKNTAALAQRKMKVVATFNAKGVALFSGFKFTVAEGLALSRRSYTEIPGLVDESVEKGDLQ
jgi:hypothetical protein